MRTTRFLVLVVALSLAGAFVSCSAAKSGGARLLDELGTVLQSSSSKMDDVLTVRQRLADVPIGELTSEQQALRNTLFRESDAFLARLTTSELDGSISSARTKAAIQAEAIAEYHAQPGSKTDFLTDLKEVTEEVIEEEGCGLILDTIAPSQRPAEAGKDADSQGGPIDSAFKKLSARWLPSSLNTAVAWAEYGESVAKDAEQFAEAVAADPEAYIPFISRPQVLRTAGVYARACYSTPRPIL